MDELDVSLTSTLWRIAIHRFSIITSCVVTAAAVLAIIWLHYSCRVSGHSSTCIVSWEPVFACLIEHLFLVLLLSLRLFTLLLPLTGDGYLFARAKALRVIHTIAELLFIPWCTQAFRVASCTSTSPPLALFVVFKLCSRCVVHGIVSYLPFALMLVFQIPA